MKRMLVASIVTAIGLALLGASTVERHIALADRAADTLDYEYASTELAVVHGYVRYVAWVPRLGHRMLNDLETRRARLRYWQRDYAALLGDGSDPMAAADPDNADLQLILANGIYRAGRQRARDARTAVQTIDAGIAAYRQVLTNPDHDPDASFNYELLARQRAVASGGRRGTGNSEAEGKSPHGQPGGTPREPEMSKYRMHVPLDPQELDQQKEGDKAGKVTPRARKG